MYVEFVPVYGSVNLNYFIKFTLILKKKPDKNVILFH